MVVHRRHWSFSHGRGMSSRGVVSRGSRSCRASRGNRGDPFGASELLWPSTPLGLLSLRVQTIFTLYVAIGSSDQEQISVRTSSVR